ncbi:hypothetical protein L211DRAFT_871927 [Terfezia boudieri ATCC MYA-4762]|uniref:Uncharacterized protein n=1 Tax=Terfezia boudieri ATCC MYA-4762 TaxID=1051890 RepID=A0A3N4L8C4_9PEZI|nr:hypothetical protein L211DRAFT_871927 [Terfezia boudieri ATCC MYA-4762]
MQAKLAFRLTDSMKTKPVSDLNKKMIKLVVTNCESRKTQVLTIDPDWLDDLEIHFLSDVGNDSELNPYKIFKDVIRKKLENGVKATLHDEKSLAYKAINQGGVKSETVFGSFNVKFGQRLRNELKKQKEAYENRLNLLTNASLDAQNYLTLEAEKKHLEEQLNQTQTNLQNTQQSITNLQTEIQAKEQNIIQLKTPDLKAKLANLKEQKGQLLTNITNLESNLEQKSEELARSLKKEQKNKTEILALKTELDSINLLLEKAKEEFKKANSKIKELQKDKKKLSEQAQSKEAELLNQIQGLNIQNTNLTKQSAALKILAEKRKADLAQEKQALIALAKKKIQNKKETSQLLEQLQAS